MSEKEEIIFKLFKSILFGLLPIVVFCWLTIWDPLFLNPIEKDLRFIFQKKNETKGIITKAEWFEEFVEVSDHEGGYVEGYKYSYVFSAVGGKKITSEGFTFQELPNEKQISQIPFQVNVEYINENPRINRIVGLPKNNESLWDVLSNMLLLPILFFAICCYISFKLIKSAVLEYRIETKRNNERLKMAEVAGFINQTYFEDGNKETNQKLKALAEKRKAAKQKILFNQRERDKLN
ncbi:hypothetical protein [Flavobacterium sp. LB1P71]|uniref:hypothetical protein n=1 Tax=Flavobacterium sp. LB1P71 TaxID=3401716 RepID=UPI003AAAFED4